MADGVNAGTSFFCWVLVQRAQDCGIWMYLDVSCQAARKESKHRASCDKTRYDTGTAGAAACAAG